MNKITFAVAVVTLGLVANVKPACADTSDYLGPIETTNQRPYQLLFLAFPPQRVS